MTLFCRLPLIGRQSRLREGRGLTSYALLDIVQVRGLREAHRKRLP